MTRTADPSRDVDRIVGAALRARRTELCLSQADVGRVLGVSHQQVAKYETGADRITAGRLAVLADHLARPIEWFFDAANGADEPRREAAIVPLDALLPDFAGTGLAVRVFFTVDEGNALTISVVALIDPGSSRSVSVLPRALYPTMLRHGAGALLAAAAAGAPPSSPDARPRAGAALN